MARSAHRAGRTASNRSRSSTSTCSKQRDQLTRESYNRPVTQNDAAMRRGAKDDAAWVGRLIADAQMPTNAGSAAAVWLCVEPYSSLFVHESHKKLKRGDTVLAALVMDDFDDIVKRGRHSLKLFEDTGSHSGFGGIDGQLAYFRDEIVPAHRAHFIDRVPRMFRWLATDLGLFTYDGKIITTSHTATFHFGMPALDLLAMIGPGITSFTEQYGRYYRHLGAQVPTVGGTFLSRVEPALMKTGPDKVAANYYASVFDGPGNADLNALLTVFQSMTNFAAYVVSCPANASTVDYTEFKIRYIAAYQVLSSLQILRQDRYDTLSPRSQSWLATIVDGLRAQELLDSATKPFRNTLIHYGIDSRVPANAIDLADPLFGLAPFYFPSCSDSADLAKLVDTVLIEAASGLNEWAKLV